MWNLSSGTRNQTFILYIARCILTAGKPGKSCFRKFYHLSLASHCSKSFSPLLNSRRVQLQQNYLRTPGKASKFWGLERCSLYFTTPRVSMHRGRPCYTLINVHGQTQTWAEDPGFCASPVPAPVETGSSYLSIPPQLYLLGGPYAFIPYALFSHWELHIKTVHKQGLPRWSTDLRLCAPSAGGLGLTPGQGTGSHTLQVRHDAAKYTRTYAVKNETVRKQRGSPFHLSSSIPGLLLTVQANTLPERLVTVSMPRVSTFY